MIMISAKIAQQCWANILVSELNIIALLSRTYVTYKKDYLTSFTSYGKFNLSLGNYKYIGPSKVTYFLKKKLVMSFNPKFFCSMYFPFLYT